MEVSMYVLKGKVILSIIIIYRCPRTHGSNLNRIFLDRNEGKKRLEK
jgi:hypothetical protein